ncbi:hypothetical protein [Stenotrophobium rhamnosiphilum]|uniref:Uncharacterized protein n=1 Tax=Stenotrophobium rhamnosiphilum TaxID=2029166 RepID=A0A2T5MF21_9GAMM|nr:hypothetical protein [Stenotrophobium rhamnosiphilum]PTU31157.1 hypothetical protein CJD38_12785 [Stenotrophobium rhamnosiphilum]
MLKKVLVAVSSLAILAAASAANAGGPSPVPVYPATGTVKIKGTEQIASSAYKIFSVTVTNQKLIRLMMGNDVNTPLLNEKNLVLGYIGDTRYCSGQNYVVWNKSTSQIVGLVAAINACNGNAQAVYPANGKSGAHTYLSTTELYFPTTEDNCSSLNKSHIYGTASALQTKSAKMNVAREITFTGSKITRLVGDVTDFVEDAGLTIVDGTFSVNYTKQLGTSNQNLSGLCE